MRDFIRFFLFFSLVIVVSLLVEAIPGGDLPFKPNCSYQRLYKHYYLRYCVRWGKRRVSGTILLFPREEEESVVKRSEALGEVIWRRGEEQNFKLPSQALKVLEYLRRDDSLKRVLRAKAFSKRLYRQGTVVFLTLNGCPLPIHLTPDSSLIPYESGFQIDYPERFVSINGRYVLSKAILFSSSREDLSEGDFESCVHLKRFGVTYCRDRLEYAMGKVFVMDKILMDKSDCHWNITLRIGIGKIDADEETPEESVAKGVIEEARKQLLRDLNIGLAW